MQSISRDAQVNAHCGRCGGWIKAASKRLCGKCHRRARHERRRRAH